MGSDRRPREGASEKVSQAVSKAVGKKVASKKVAKKRAGSQKVDGKQYRYTRQSLTAIESVVVEYRCVEPECETCGQLRATRIPRVGYTILLPGEIMCAVCGELCDWDRGVRVETTGGQG